MAGPVIQYRRKPTSECIRIPAYLYPKAGKGAWSYIKTSQNTALRNAKKGDIGASRNLWPKQTKIFRHFCAIS